MSEPQVRLKLEWAVAIQLGSIVIAAGILIGQLMALQRKVENIEAALIPVARVIAIEKAVDRVTKLQDDFFIGRAIAAEPDHTRKTP